MKKIKTISASIVVVLVALLTCSFVEGDISKAEAEKRIEQWYAKHPQGYNLDLSGKKVELKVTRYHPERPEEKDDIITAKYAGMQIEIKFSKPLLEIDRTAAAFQENFSYVAVSKIYNDIDVPGWEVHPRTPQSSNRKNNSVKFTTVTDIELAFELNWEIYTVFGYSTKKKCQDELGIMDAGVSEGCIAGVDKRIPIMITVDGKL